MEKTTELRGTVVRDEWAGEEGVATGGTRSCRCGGTSIAVRWPSGRVDYPCLKGMDYDENADRYVIVMRDTDGPPPAGSEVARAKWAEAA